MRYFLTTTEVAHHIFKVKEYSKNWWALQQNRNQKAVSENV